LTAAEYVSDGFVFLATPNIKEATIDFDNVHYISEYRYAESPELQLRVGDVLLAKDGNTLGIVNLVTELPRPATVNGSIAVIRPLKVEPRFLRYFMESRPIQSLMDAMKGGMGVPHLFQFDLNRFPLLVPPADVQRAVADYLDRETARIDALITKKRRLITLVEERALARIYAGIRGLQQNGMRKSAGLAWLGDIPESWPVMPVAAQFEVLLGKMLDQSRVAGEHLKPYLRNTSVQWDRVDIDDLLLMDFPPQERLRYQVLPGDLLVCEGGEPGRAAVWDGKIPEIYYQKALHRVRPRGQSTARWLFYCLRAAVAMNVFGAAGNTTTISHLTAEQLRAHRFPFPDRSVQERLAMELDEQAIDDDRLLRLVRVQIGRLDEHRQALITAAVTGQIDVAEAA
jgi:type I restriction enzyme S subunit